MYEHATSVMASWRGAAKRRPRNGRFTVILSELSRLPSLPPPLLSQMAIGSTFGWGRQPLAGSNRLEPSTAQGQDCKANCLLGSKLLAIALQEQGNHASFLRAGNDVGSSVRRDSLVTGRLFPGVRMLRCMGVPRRDLASERFAAGDDKGSSRGHCGAANIQW